MKDYAWGRGACAATVALGVRFANREMCFGRLSLRHPLGMTAIKNKLTLQGATIEGLHPAGPCCIRSRCPKYHLPVSVEEDQGRRGRMCDRAGPGRFQISRTEGSSQLRFCVVEVDGRLTLRLVSAIFEEYLGFGGKGGWTARRRSTLATFEGLHGRP